MSSEAYEQALEKHWEGICAEARTILFPALTDQEGYWKRKEDEYEAYLDDLHRRQQDPEYVASYKKWLDESQSLFPDEN